MQTRVRVGFVWTLALSLAVTAACDCARGGEAPLAVPAKPVQQVSVEERPAQERARTVSALREEPSHFLSGAGPLVPHVTARSVRWRGKVDKDAQTQAVKDVGNLAKACVPRGPIYNAGPRGTVRVAVSFQRDGTVVESGVGLDRDDPEVITCLRKQFGALYISPLLFKGDVHLSMTLGLSTYRVCVEPRPEPSADPSSMLLNPYR